jgi:hypothetical protein
MHFTPTSASWINQVERFFALLTDRALSRGIFRSVAELEAAVRAYIDAHNADLSPSAGPKRLTTSSPASKRFCLRTLPAKMKTTSESGH